MDLSLAYQHLRARPALTPPILTDIAATIVHDEMHRKLRAISHAANSLPADTTALQAMLYDLDERLPSRGPLVNFIDSIGAGGDLHEEQAVATLRLDFAAFTYYCATLQEIFTDRLDGKRLAQATASDGGRGSFDSLARARNAFVLGAPVAWRLVSNFRSAWSMETRDISKIASQP